MQRWEYLTVEVYCIHGLVNPEPERLYQSGKSIPEAMTRDAYFFQLGDQGWELAGVVNIAGGNTTNYTFKRPKP